MRQYIAGESGKCVEHVMKKLVAWESMTVVGVPPIIKISGRQKRLLEPKNWKFVTVIGYVEAEASLVIIDCSRSTGPDNVGIMRYQRL